ncbi:MAG: methylated-DNA--[protein]-cysteine S-methyltransferase [Methanoregula sp.]|jgi:methylated-DNA-[protein]-cysteine S-methyltransferase
MEILGGSCRLGLWFVHVWWNDRTVHQVRFARTGMPGRVPELIRRYCGEQVVNLSELNTPAIQEDTVYGRIYLAVQQVPYGSTSTYGEIAAVAGTSPRVVGQAMARNPVPLVIPCHRIVAAGGIGGFSSPVEIKEALLAMEKKGLRKAEK